MGRVKCIKMDEVFDVFERSNSTSSRFKTPVIHIPDTNGASITLNEAAKKMLNNDTGKVFFASFRDYIAIMPDNGKMPGNALFSYNKSQNYVYYPVSVKEARVKPGYYRAYKCGDGIAFNRYSGGIKSPC